MGEGDQSAPGRSIMITNVLVAVDDSPASLAGVRLAIELSTSVGATLCAVAVVPDQPVVEWEASSRPQLLQQAGTRLLDYVSRLARQAGASIATALVEGEPARCILDHARAVAADVIVVGRSAQPGPGQPYIGSQTRHVLEFAEAPVIVVPPLPTDHRQSPTTPDRPWG